MESWVLAHGSGIDEMLIFGWPVVVGIVYWLIIRKRPEDEPDDSPPPP